MSIAEKEAQALAANVKTMTMANALPTTDIDATTYAAYMSGRTASPTEEEAAAMSRLLSHLRLADRQGRRFTPADSDELRKLCGALLEAARLAVVQ